MVVVGAECVEFTWDPNAPGTGVSLYEASVPNEGSGPNSQALWLARAGGAAGLYSTDEVLLGSGRFQGSWSDAQKRHQRLYRGTIQ